MILHGRITVYGEYLMKTSTRGLIVPSACYLATDDYADKPRHAHYDPARDSVARMLEKFGVQPLTHVRGDLPFGYGLASSSALALLHLSRTRSRAQALSLVHDIDRAVHGFEPSGVDATAIFQQRSGFYSANGWEDVALRPLRVTLEFLPRERKRTLAEIEQRMREPTPALTRLAERMTARVASSGELDYDVLLDYCRVLLAADVYSQRARSRIAGLLDRGIAAKTIGGLYDKAVLVIWPVS